MYEESGSESHSVVSDSLQLHGQVPGLLQAKILGWVAFPFSRGSSQPRDQAQVSRIAGGFFYQLSHKGNPKILERVAYRFSSASLYPGIKLGSPVLQVESLPTELSGNVFISLGYMPKDRIAGSCD